MELTKEQKDNFIKVISDGKCPFCGGKNFSTPTEGEIQNLAGIKYEKNLTFMSLPVYILVCNKCGYYSFFNLGVIKRL